MPKHTLATTLLTVAGAVMALGMFCLFMSADARQREREAENASEQANLEATPPTPAVADTRDEASQPDM
jgi:hypothetical protein